MSTTSGEVSYSFGTPYPDVLVRGRACKVAMPVRYNGALVAPTVSGSSFSLIAPDGSEVVSAQAVTVVNNVARYTIAAVDLPATLTLGEGYQERWTLVLSDRTETVDREAGLCMRPLYPVISDADLTRRYSMLSRTLPTGTTTYQSKIDAAWEEIIRRLWREGVLPYSVKSPDQLSQPHFHLTMHYLYDDCALAQPNVAGWRERAAEHLDRYEKAWAPASWRADTDLDGTVDDPNLRGGNGVVMSPGGSPAYTALSARLMGV